MSAAAWRTRRLVRNCGIRRPRAGTPRLRGRRVKLKHLQMRAEALQAVDDARPAVRREVPDEAQEFRIEFLRAAGGQVRAGARHSP